MRTRTKVNARISVASAVVGGMLISVSSALASGDVPSGIGSISAAATQIGSYYSGAKTALDVAKTLGVALGLINPDDADAQYQTLMAAINNASTGISWQITDDFITQYRAQAIAAIQRVKHSCDGKGASCILAATQLDDRDTAVAVEALSLSDSAFYRPFGTSSDNALKADLNLSLTTDLYAKPGNMVYDWRMGIPAFLELISYRLQVIAALDQHFRTDGTYWSEMDGYRTALVNHYGKMLKGIRVHSYGVGSCPYLLGCSDTAYDVVDIHSGAAIRGGSVSSGARPPILTAAQRDLIASLPLFEVKAMIDTLYIYTHAPASDLTESLHRVPSYSSPALCLEADGAGEFFNFQANLSACSTIQTYGAGETPTVRQTWYYDRKSGTIRNPTLASPSTGGVCLGISHSTYALASAGALTATNALPVSIAPCSDGRWQQWTYDPGTHVLLSAMGTVLDVQWSNLIPGALVWSWPLNATAAQLWKAELPVLIVY